MNTTIKNNGAITLAKQFAGFLGANTGKRSDCTIIGYRTAIFGLFEVIFAPIGLRTKCRLLKSMAKAAFFV